MTETTNLLKHKSIQWEEKYFMKMLFADDREGKSILSRKRYGNAYPKVSP